MSQEIYKKHNPYDLTPSHFCTPPTSVVWRHLLPTINDIAQTLEGRRQRRKLLVGTELEILLFSPEIDPYVGASWLRSAKQNIEGYSIPNANYGQPHLNKVNELYQYLGNWSDECPTEMLRPSLFNRLMVELRTAPVSPAHYIDLLDQVRTRLQGLFLRNEVLVTVYSQHIHLTLNNADGSSYYPSDNFSNYWFPIRPLVLLPQEWDRRFSSPFLPKETILVRDNMGEAKQWVKRSQVHPEFRMLSSEYAHDPILNLALVLASVHRDVSAPSLTRDIVSRIFGRILPKRKPRRQDKTYVDSCNFLPRSPLTDYFGRETLTMLSSILELYPMVSTREITVDEIPTIRKGLAN